MESKTLVKICGLRRIEDAGAANRVLPDFAGFILSPGFRRSISLEEAAELRRILDPRITTVGVFVNASIEEIIEAAGSGAIDMIQLHGKEDDHYINTIASLTSLPVIKAFRISTEKDLEAASASAAHWILLDSGTGTGSRFDWELLAAYFEKKRLFRKEGHTSFGQSLEDGQNHGIEEKPELQQFRELCKKAESYGKKELSKCPSNAADSACAATVDASKSKCPSYTADRLFPGNHPWLLAGGLSVDNVGEAIRRFCPTSVDVSSRVETDGKKDPAKMQAFTEAVRNQ